MKKCIITLLILFLIFIAFISFFYIRFINLDTYKWDSDKGIITCGNKKYKEDFYGSTSNVKLKKQIGKVEANDSFRIWAIEGENVEEAIAINGFMFPPIVYRRIIEMGSN